jgi:hypothetical protein
VNQGLSGTPDRVPTSCSHTYPSAISVQDLRLDLELGGFEAKPHQLIRTEGIAPPDLSSDTSNLSGLTNRKSKPKLLDMPPKSARAKTAVKHEDVVEIGTYELLRHATLYLLLNPTFTC